MVRCRGHTVVEGDERPNCCCGSGLRAWRAASVALLLADVARQLSSRQFDRDTRLRHAPIRETQDMLCNARSEAAAPHVETKVIRIVKNSELSTIEIMVRRIADSITRLSTPSPPVSAREAPLLAEAGQPRTTERSSCRANRKKLAPLLRGAPLFLDAKRRYH